MNELVFFTSILAVSTFSLGVLSLGKEALVAFICLQGLLSNLFVTKQIMLFGLDVTSSDIFAVGTILSLNLLQEYYGPQIVKKAISLLNYKKKFFFSNLKKKLLLWIHMNIRKKKVL